MSSRIVNVATLIIDGVKITAKNIIRKEEFKVIRQCTGNCNCCGCNLKATDITIVNGVATITVADGSFDNLRKCDKICIGLFTDYSNTTVCNRVRVSDGSTTLDIMINNQYYRPCRLECKSTIVTYYLDDPEVLKFNELKFFQGR